MDSTHSTTNGFLVNTILSLDTNENGYPLFHMISSNETTPTIEIFLKQTKPEIQKIIGLREVTLVTDDHSPYVNS